MGREKMNKEIIENAIKQYFKTLAEHGRTVNPAVSPMGQIIDKEYQFIEYLDQNDQYCMFCLKDLIVLQIDYNLQRPVWGCLNCRFTKGLQKIKWLNHRGDCGTVLNLSPELLEDQQKYLKADNVITTCDKCIGNGNILQEEDMNNVHIKEYAKV